MGKAKTSQKPEKFKGPSVEPIKLSKEGMKKLLSKTTSYSPTAELADPNFAVSAMFECLLENDIESFKEIVKWHYEAVNITHAMKKAKLSPRTFFEAISAKGNPSLKTVGKVFKGIASEPTFRPPSMSMKAK